MSAKAPASPYTGSHSAGDFEWREIRVSIAPQGADAVVSVSVRRRRGLALEWERRLGSIAFALPQAGELGSRADVLRAAAQALFDVAQRADT